MGPAAATRRDELDDVGRRAGALGADARRAGRNPRRAVCAGGEAGRDHANGDQEHERAGGAPEDGGKVFETRDPGGQEPPGDTEADEADRCSHDHAAGGNGRAKGVATTRARPRPRAACARAAVVMLPRCVSGSS